MSKPRAYIGVLPFACNAFLILAMIESIIAKISTQEMRDATILSLRFDGSFRDSNQSLVPVTDADIDFVSVKALVSRDILLKLIPLDGFRFASVRRDNLFRDERLSKNHADWVYIGVGSRDLHLFISETDADQLVAEANRLCHNCLLVRPSFRGKTPPPIASTAASHLSQTNILEVFQRAHIKTILCCGFNQKSSSPAFIGFLDELARSDPHCHDNVFSVGFDFLPPGCDGCLTLVRSNSKASEIYPLELCGDFGSFSVRKSINSTQTNINVYSKLRHWHVAVMRRLNRFKGVPQYPSRFMEQVEELSKVVSKLPDIIPQVAHGFRIEFSGIVCATASEAIRLSDPLLAVIATQVNYAFLRYADYRSSIRQATELLLDPVYRGTALKTRLPGQLTTGALGLLSSLKILVGLTDRKPRGRFKSKGKNAAWWNSAGRVLRKVQQLREAGSEPSQENVLRAFDADHRAQARSKPVVMAQNEHLNRQRFIDWVKIRRHPNEGVKNPWFLQSKGRVYGSSGFGDGARNKRFRGKNEIFDPTVHLTAAELRGLLVEAYSSAEQLGIRDTWTDVLDLRRNRWDGNELPTCAITGMEGSEGGSESTTAVDLPSYVPATHPTDATILSTPLAKKRRIINPALSDISTRGSDQTPALQLEVATELAQVSVQSQYRLFANIFFAYWLGEPQLALKGDTAMIQKLRGSNEIWTKIRESVDDRLKSMPGYTELSSLGKRSVYDWFKRGRLTPSDADLCDWLADFKRSDVIHQATINQVIHELERNESVAEHSLDSSLIASKKLSISTEKSVVPYDSRQILAESDLDASPWDAAHRSDPRSDNEMDSDPSSDEETDEALSGAVDSLEQIDLLISSMQERRKSRLFEHQFRGIVRLTTAVTPAGSCKNIDDFRLKVFFQELDGEKPSAVFRAKWALFLRAMTHNQLIELSLSTCQEASSDVQINRNSYDDSQFFKITAVCVTSENKDQYFKLSSELTLLSGSDDFLTSWRCDKPRDWMPFSSLIDCSNYKNHLSLNSNLPLLKLCGIVIGNPGRPVGVYQRNDGGRFLSTQLCVVDSSLRAASAIALRQAAFSSRDIPQFSFQHYTQGESVYELTWPVVGQLVIATHVHVESKHVKTGVVYFNVWVEAHFDGERSLKLYNTDSAPTKFQELAAWGRRIIATQNLVDPHSQFSLIGQYGKAGMDIVVQYKEQWGNNIVVHDSHQEKHVELTPVGTENGAIEEKSIQWVLSNLRPNCWLMLTRVTLVDRRMTVRACNIIEIPEWSLDVQQRLERFQRSRY